MSVDQVDIVILTALQIELTAVLAALGLHDGNRARDVAGTFYYSGSVRSALSGFAHRVAVTCIGAAGNPGAAAAVRDAIAFGKPRVVLFAGIAAGIRDQVRIGDVVLSDRVVSYEPAALVAGSGGSRAEPRPEIDRLPHRMNQHLASYRADPTRIAQIIARIGEPLSNLSADSGGEPASVIEVHRATIASGEKLLRDPAALEEIRGLHGKVAAVDMESAGVVSACRRGELPWLIIRGISDFGDTSKSDRFHDFAARAAAAVLADFLRNGLDLAPADALGSGTGDAARSPRPPATLSPRYSDERTRHLSERLQDALRRRRALAEAGAGTTDVGEEVLQLKRQLREGGQLRPGDALGGDRYLLLEPIGRGGFASVWKALDRVQDAIIAIKALHPEIAGDPVRRDRFIRGARIMAELDDPAVARVLAPVAEDDGFFYFVMEYMPGGDLRRAVLDGRVSKSQALLLLRRAFMVIMVGHTRSTTSPFGCLICGRRRMLSCLLPRSARASRPSKAGASEGRYTRR